MSQPDNIGTFTYNYDAALQLTAINTPSGSAVPPTTFTYDTLGRLSSRKRGDATWAYNTQAGLTTSTLPTGEVTRTLLDGRGRMAERTRQASEGAPIDLTAVKYSYGANDEPLAVVEERLSGNVTIDYAYDARRRISQEKRGSDVVSFGYHGDSDLLAQRTSSAGSVQYTYDGFGRTRAIQGLSAATFTWEAGGERVLEVSGGGLYQRRCYDNAGRIISIVNSDTAVGCGTTPFAPLARFDYEYDARGNPTREFFTDWHLFPNDEETQYAYDAADRLTGVRYGTGETALYKLDGAGTRIEEKHLQGYAGPLGPEALATASTPGTDHLLYEYDLQGGIKKVGLAGGGTHAQYLTDPSGRLTQETRGITTRSFTWDGQRLASVQVNDGSVLQNLTYRYDHTGRRIQRQGATDTTNYRWSAGELIEERPQGGSPILHEQAEGIPTAAGGKRSIQDALGSHVGALDSPNPVLYRYDAWGSHRTHPANPHWTQPTTASPGYAAQHWDPESSLSYAQQRWYAPLLGTFLSEDPIQGDLGFPVTLHTVTYANSNPLRYIDPEGEFALTTGGAIGGYFWGFSQVMYAVYNDLQNSRIRASSEYTDLWVQNFIGGIEIGASLDVAVLSFGGAIHYSNALGGAGVEALTFDGEAKSWSEFGIAQAEGAAMGVLVGGAVGKIAQAAGRLVPWRTVAQKTGVLAQRIFATGINHSKRAYAVASEHVGSILKKHIPTKNVLAAADDGLLQGGRGTAERIEQIVEGLPRASPRSSPPLVGTRGGGAEMAFAVAGDGINPSTIRFTQESISRTFKGEGAVTLRETIDGLKAGSISPQAFPPIRVFERNGLAFTLDNRRLFVFQQARLPIRTVPATAQEVAAEAWKFTTRNEGVSIRVRGGL